MKYIKLYEAFSSNTLSKLYAHLKKKNASQNSLSNFKKKMSESMAALGIPMDKISDEDVSYLSRKKALMLKSENIENEKGVGLVKFWFDKDGEYIEATGTGKFAIKQSKQPIGENCKPFNQTKMDYIKQNPAYFPETGYLMPIPTAEYSPTIPEGSIISNGDYAIATLIDRDGYFDDECLDRIAYGRLFIDEDDKVLYMLHNNEDCEGSEPDDMPEWGFSYGWKISNNTDHFNFHKVIKSSKPLSYYSELSEIPDSEDPFEINFSISKDGHLSTLGSSEEKKIKNEADFAIVLRVDDILKRGLKSPKETSLEREEARKGATALMSDEEFKSINLERYMENLIKVIGISPEAIELKNLEKAVASIVSSGAGESYSFFAAISADYRAMDSFCFQIKKMASVQNLGEDAIKAAYDSFYQNYMHIRNNAKERMTARRQAMAILKRHTELDPITDAMSRISNKITKSILSKKISRGEDIKKICFKLKSLYEMMRDNDYELSYTIRNFLDRILNSEERLLVNYIESAIEDYAIRTGDNKTTLLEIDLKKLQEIESYVDDIFTI
jgi:hypothetical protein